MLRRFLIFTKPMIRLGYFFFELLSLVQNESNMKFPKQLSYPS